MDPGDPNILERPTFPAPFEKYTRTTEEDIWDNDLHQEEKMKVEVRRGIICQIIVETKSPVAENRDFSYSVLNLVDMAGSEISTDSEVMQL